MGLAVPGRDCSGLATLAVVPSLADKSSFCLGSKLGGSVLLLLRWAGHVRGGRVGRALGCCGSQAGRCVPRTRVALQDELGFSQVEEEVMRHPGREEPGRGEGLF